MESVAGFEDAELPGTTKLPANPFRSQPAGGNARSELELVPGVARRQAVYAEDFH